MKCGNGLVQPFPIQNLESRAVGCSVADKAKVININIHFISRANGTGNYTVTGHPFGPGYNGNQLAADTEWNLSGRITDQ